MLKQEQLQLADASFRDYELIHINILAKTSHSNYINDIKCACVCVFFVDQMGPTTACDGLSKKGLLCVTG